MERLAERAKRIGPLLIESGESVVVGEGAAGGLISAALLSVPGASRFFVAGSVLYTREGFANFLGEGVGRLRGLQGATEPFSLEVARIAREKFDSTWAIAESGAAGPDGNRYGDPPGHAAIAVVGPTEHAVTLRTGVDGRCENMQRFAEAALDLLGTALRRRRE